MTFTLNEMDPRSREEQYSEYISGLPKHHPERVKYEAENMPWKSTATFALAEYSEAINSLRKRGYSYAEIAEWLAQKTGNKGINRGHVYRTYQHWCDMEAQRLEEAYERGEIDEISLTHIPDEEAEKRAAAEDERREAKGKEGTP